MPGFSSLDYADAELFDSVLARPSAAVPLDLPLTLKSKAEGATPVVSATERALLREEEAAKQEYFRQQKAKQDAIEEEIFKWEQLRRDEIRRRVAPAEPPQEPRVTSRDYESQYRPKSADNPTVNKPPSPASPPVDVATQSGARPTALIDPTVPPSSAVPRSAVSGPAPEATARPSGLPQAIGRVPVPVIGGAIDFGFRLVAGQPIVQAASGAAASTLGSIGGAAVGAVVAGPVGAFVGGIIGGFVAGAISDANFRSLPKTAIPASEPYEGLPPFIGGQTIGIQYNAIFSNDTAEYINAFTEKDARSSARTVSGQVVSIIKLADYTYDAGGGQIYGWASYDIISFDGTNYTKRLNGVYSENRPVNAQNPTPTLVKFVPVLPGQDTGGNPPALPIKPDTRTPRSIAHPGNQEFAVPRATPEARNNPAPNNYVPGGLTAGGTPRGDAPDWIPHAGLAPRQNPNPTTTPSNLGGNLPEITPTPINTPSPKENSPLVNKTPQNSPPENTPALGGGFNENSDPHHYKTNGSSYSPTGSSTGLDEKPLPSGLPQSKKTEVPEDGLKLLPVIPPLAIPTTTPQTPTDPLSTPNQPPTVPPGGNTNNPCEGNACASSIRNAVQGNSSKLDGLNAALNGLDLAGLGEVLKRLDKIDDKLGAQIPNGGLSGFLQQFFDKFNKVASWLHLDRMLNVLTWINTTHNAYMLSSSLADTLFSVIDNIGNIFFKNADGNDIDTRSLIGTTIENFAKNLFGVETWTGIKTTWKKWNRIYQAGANIINSVRSIVDSVRNVSEFVAENIGRIGNALKKFGVVGERAYRWMPEQVNSQSVWVQRLQNLEDAASGLEMITSEVLSVTENINQIKQQTDEFKKSISDSPTKEQSENTAVKTQADASKAVSAAVALAESDKEADD
ncbi:hypothetical protein [Mastigocladopsis repens]|uniref:hypothetical protein n=1 Tax=Mastigocladopsis repens TaxID=221287 RepID=UPI0002F9E1B3|nr:hypothetical protein [Mastigocladopsis repens]